MDGTISLIGIVIGLALFIWLAFRGYNTVVVAIAASAVVALFGQADIYKSLSEFFMPKFVGFAQGYFLIFLFSAIFAKIMGDSGAAPSIAVKVSRLAKLSKSRDVQRFLAVLTLPIVNAILTMGGVSVFVVVFVLVGIARTLFKDLDIPWWMYTCSCLGSSTFTIGMMPGSPQIQNIIPQEYFGTTTTAAPVLGIICTLLTIALGCCYIMFQVKRVGKTEQHFLPTGELMDKENIVDPAFQEMPLWKCLAPMIVLFVVLNGFKQNAVISLFCACVVAWILYDPRKLNLKSIFAGALPQAVMPLITVCCASGFGGVVSNMSGFAAVTAGLDSLGSGAFQIVLAVNICSGICGSASSGENVALSTLSEKFIATGIPGPQLHRLIAMSSTGLDTLPHSAGVITALSTTKLTHKQAYINFFVLSVVLPIVISLIAAFLISSGFYY